LELLTRIVSFGRKFGILTGVFLPWWNFLSKKKKKTQNPKRRARPHLAFTLVSHPCPISLSIFNFHCIIFELSVHWYQFFSPNQFSSYVICPRDRPNFPGEEEHLQKQDYPQQQEKRWIKDIMMQNLTLILIESWGEINSIPYKTIVSVIKYCSRFVIDFPFSIYFC